MQIGRDSGGIRELKLKFKCRLQDFALQRILRRIDSILGGRLRRNPPPEAFVAKSSPESTAFALVDSWPVGSVHVSNPTPLRTFREDCLPARLECVPLCKAKSLGGFLNSLTADP